MAVARVAQPRKRGWVYTLNNYTAEDEALFSGYVAAEQCVYVCFGREVGESGTPHLQGYVYFRNPKMLMGVKKLFPRAHLEFQRGTVEEAVTYCQKDGDFHEFGERPMSSGDKGEVEKRRWEDARVCLMEGRYTDIPADICFRSWGNMKRYKMDIEDQASKSKLVDSDVLDNYWFYGNPRTGKSRSARKIWPDLYTKQLNKWWDEYRYEDTILIEDIDPKSGAYMATFIKTWTDHYKYPAQYKGGSRSIRPVRFIITSNYSIAEVWPDEPMTVKPLQERFKEIYFNTGVPTSVQNMIHAAEAERAAAVESQVSESPAAAAVEALLAISP